MHTHYTENIISYSSSQRKVSLEAEIQIGLTLDKSSDSTANNCTLQGAFSTKLKTVYSHFVVFVLTFINIHLFPIHLYFLRIG